MANQFGLDFDFEALETQLYSSLKLAFNQLQLDFPDEQFYNFTLYVSPSMVYCSIAANTEDLLSATAREYREKYPKYAKVSFEETKEYFRHEFGDFVRYFAGSNIIPYDAIIEKANNLLNEFSQKTEQLLDSLLERFDDDFDTAWIIVGPPHERVLDICVTVMKRLDEDGVFEVNSSRDDVTILVRHGDSEADPEVARRLNPDKVYRRFLNEQKHAEKIRKLMYGY